MNTHVCTFCEKPVTPTEGVFCGGCGSAENLVEITGSVAGPAVPAEVHTDDWQATARFDCAGFLETCTDGELAELAECGWGGDYPADSAARHYDGTDPEVTAVFAHIDRARVGFECHIDQAAASAWLAARRPSLFEMFA